MGKHLLSFAALSLAFCLSGPASAGVERELKKMTGFTIIHGGYVKDRIERNYSEKLIQLDNGWVFKLDCMMLMPLNFTDVVVFGKRYPEELTNKYPDLPEHLMYEFKLLIDRDICEASLVQ